MACAMSSSAGVCSTSAASTCATRAVSLRACPARAALPSRRAGVQVHASIKPPAGVVIPPRQPEVPPPTFGFVHFAEKINGRAAMLGFISIILIESIAGKGLLEMVGLQVGKGLGFEF